MLPIFRSLGQHLQDAELERFGDAEVEQLEAGRRLQTDFGDQLLGLGGLERRLAREHGVGGGAEAVDVRPGVDRLAGAVGAFGRHERQCGRWFAGRQRRRRIAGQGAGQHEIDELGPDRILAHKNVSRRDALMDDVLAMNVNEGPRRIQEHAQHLLPVHEPGGFHPADDGPQTLGSANVLHGHPAMRPRLAGAVHLDQVRMAQRQQRPHGPDETLHRLVVAAVLRLEHFQGDVEVLAHVAGVEDAAERAAGEHRADLELAELLAGQAAFPGVA